MHRGLCAETWGVERDIMGLGGGGLVDGVVW
jgi:hypothetical protein